MLFRSSASGSRRTGRSLPRVPRKRSTDRWSKAFLRTGLRVWVHSAGLIRAVHAFLARTPASILLVHLADAVDLAVPGEQEAATEQRLRPLLPALKERLRRRAGSRLILGGFLTTERADVEQDLREQEMDALDWGELDEWSGVTTGFPT